YLPTRTKINQPLLGHGRDCLDRLLLNLEEALRFFQAKAVDHGLVGKLCPPDAAEATIATRGSPARLPGFEDTHRKMMIALQMQGGRQACIATADYSSIAKCIFFQRRTGRRMHACAFFPPAGSFHMRVEQRGGIKGHLGNPLMKGRKIFSSEAFDKPS